MLPNVVKIYVENDNVVSTLSTVEPLSDWAKSKHCLTIVQLNIFDTLQSRLRQISLWSFEESL